MFVPLAAGLIQQAVSADLAVHSASTSTSGLTSTLTTSKPITSTNVVLDQKNPLPSSLLASASTPTNPPAALALSAHKEASLALACLSCHGSGAMVRLNGQPEVVLAKKINDYAHDLTKGTIMHQLLKGYTEPELAALAHYFSHAQPINDVDITSIQHFNVNDAPLKNIKNIKSIKSIKGIKNTKI